MYRCIAVVILFLIWFKEIFPHLYSHYDPEISIVQYSWLNNIIIVKHFVCYSPPSNNIWRESGTVQDNLRHSSCGGQHQGYGGDGLGSGGL